MPDTPVPTDAKRILLVNPTKYLGNLLIAGGLMQSFARHCLEKGLECKILIDESFRELCESSFPEDTLLYFPRRKINQAGIIGKLLLYRKSVNELRSFKADLAFNIEEDSATSHLTRLSGAAFKMGCSQKKHKSGYDYVVPVEFENRPPDQLHRWFSFLDIFSEAGLSAPDQPGYLRLQLPETDAALWEKLDSHGVDTTQALVAIHAGATKEYKQWPVKHYVALCLLLLEHQMQPVLLGAGTADREINRAILEELDHTHIEKNIINLCDALLLSELARFLPHCRFMVGNDSGPFHLGSALGITGSVIWGPTNKDIWGPLGDNSNVLNNENECDPSCSKGHCLKDYQCLRTITPQRVFNSLS